MTQLNCVYVFVCTTVLYQFCVLVRPVNSGAMMTVFNNRIIQYNVCQGNCMFPADSGLPPCC